MKHKLLFLPFLVAIVGLSMLGPKLGVSPTVSVVSEAKADGPVVVELFTSQSCSSCPPADELLGELAAKDANIIAFSCHVTYWDHLNWRDTWSRKFCTNRQRAYARHLGSKQVYTPQMVVNGAHEFVGSNRAKAQRQVAAGAGGAVLAIELKQTADGLTATLPALPAGSPKQTLWLLRYQSSHTQAIKSGENRGKTITYTNSVDTLDQVGVWDGAAETRTFPTPEGEAESPGFAVIAQPNGFGAISAAGRI